MGSFLARASSILAVILALPTFLILISWNALPGDRLYGLKRGLEVVPRAILGDSKASADYEVFVTDRRFAEAATLVKADNTVGLSELDASIVAARNQVVVTANDQARQKLINNLIIYNQKLEEEKRTIAAAAPVSTSPQYIAPTTPPSSYGTQPAPTPTAPTPTSSPPPPTQTRPTSSPPTVTPSPTPTTSTTTTQTVQAINQTQQEIQKTIDDLKKNEEKGGFMKEKQDNSGTKSNQGQERGKGGKD